MSTQNTFSSSNGKNVLSPQDLFVLEQDVMKNLAIYYNKYRLYITCTNNEYKQYIDNTICPTDLNSLNSLSSEYSDALTALNTSLTNLTNAITAVKGSTSNSISRAEHINNYYIIKNMYDKVVKDRRDLDSSLTELYEIGDTTNTFYQTQLVRTSYMKIMLIIVASSLTFAAFMTMRNNNK